MRKSKLRAILLSMMLTTAGILQPTSAFAQFDWFFGLFGKGSEEISINPQEEEELDEGVIPDLETFHELNYYDYEGGLFSKGPNALGESLFNQGFGEIPTGITIEPFQENSPIGNGLLIMLLGGIGYASIKKRKKESNQ